MENIPTRKRNESKVIRGKRKNPSTNMLFNKSILGKSAMLITCILSSSTAFYAGTNVKLYTDKNVRIDMMKHGIDSPYEEASYDPEKADDFFRSKPLASINRLGQLVGKSSGFITSVMLDKKFGKEDEKAEQRSQELLELMTSLGPTFIKIGQALSTRTDLLSAKYADGLTGLQDAVPPFSSETARSIIEEELGIKIDEVFSVFSPEPVASASIGQVYKGTLRKTGQDVAVKVQRPEVLKNIALDLFMMRSLAPKWQEFQDINSDLVGLVDAWGEGFVNELDYSLEAEATKEFSESMRQRGLTSVFSPEVVDNLSSKHVLTTKWVDGERLASSNADDVPRLCGVALNAYLTMMLDTGTLHCDPHPGNLLRTPDGRLCILDWGMVITVPNDLQLSLLEFIANLNAENYEEVPNDLVKLSFVPEDKLEELRSSGMTIAISKMLKLAGEGGGPKGAMQRMVQQNKDKYADQLAQFDDIDSPEAKKLRQKLFREDWQKEMAEDATSRTETGSKSTTLDLTNGIEELQKQNSDVFAIPDYFVYMSRAFATLEGIGLSSDNNYSITKACFPYLAKRVLSDDSPRARGALRTLLYGKDGELNLSKLQELTTGLESYTVSTSSVQTNRDSSDKGRNVAAEQLTSVILAEESNYVQELLLNETATMLDASVRNAFSPTFTNIQRLPSLAPPVPFGALFTSPLSLVKEALEFQTIDARDKKRLENVRILREIAGSISSKTNDRSNAADGNIGEVVGRLAQEAAARQNALRRIGARFGGTLASVQANRLRQRAEKKGEASNSSKLAGRIAISGAKRLDDLASTILLLDR